MDDHDTAHLIEIAPFAIVSHGTEADPIFNYANTTALRLFEMTWDQFTALPSRLSAEAMLQQDRERLLEKVARNGYVDGYSGVRISGTGRRFLIRNATIWNLLDEHGQPYGQAALLPEWQPLAEV